MNALTQEQLAQFRQRGFAVIGRLLENDELRELQEEYDRLFAEARQTARMRNLSSADGGAATDHQRILDIAEDLIGPNLQLFHDQALYKPVHCGGPIHWHQDNGYWQCAPANLVSCWMTLDDVDVHNGAMHVIPGSHLQPVAHEREQGTPLFDVGDKIDASAAEVIELPAGGVMFHHCQTLHHTPRNSTDRQRRAFAIHFMNPGTRSLRKDFDMEVSFSRPLLRMRASS